MREEAKLQYQDLGESVMRRVQNSEATNDPVFSESTGGNVRVFPRILKLYMTPGGVVADVTYGKGVFWRRAPSEQYKVLPTDIQHGVDCRKFPML